MDWTNEATLRDLILEASVVGLMLRHQEWDSIGAETFNRGAGLMLRKRNYIDAAEVEDDYGLIPLGTERMLRHLSRSRQLHMQQ